MSTVEQLAALVLEETKRRIATTYSEDLASRETVTVKPGRVYTKIDRSGSGMLMIENATGNVYGIKSYGQVHKGHQYGTLATIGTYFWGEFYPRPATDAEVAARTTTDAEVAARTTTDSVTDFTPKPVEAPSFEVGDGATVHYGSDACAFTVIAVSASGKTVMIQRDHAKLDESFRPDFTPGGFCGHVSNVHAQTYTYTRDRTGEIHRARLGLRGWKSNGLRVSAGRREMYDYNF
jgi:hypothetical protein